MLQSALIERESRDECEMLNYLLNEMTVIIIGTQASSFLVVVFVFLRLASPTNLIFVSKT